MINGPHRQCRRVRRLEPLATAVKGAPLDVVVATVRARIRINRHVTSEGTWLLCDRKGSVYALKQTGVGVQDVLNRHQAWIVGLYFADHANGEAGSMPDEAVIRDGLVEHLIEVGFITQQDIRAAVRDVEG